MGIRQWTNVAVGVILAGMAFIIWIATALHLADEQFITDDELQRNLQQLQSYTAESQVLDRYTRQGSALHPYTLVYASSLKKSD